MTLPEENHQRFELIESQLWLTLSTDLRRATLHFNSPQSRNAVSFAMAEKLADLSRALLGNDPSHPVGNIVRNGQLLLLVLKSHCPDVFISGGNLKDISHMTHAQGQTLTENMRLFTGMLRQGPVVSVALLNGVSVGGGAEIALATDLRATLSPTARVHFAQTQWAVPAGWGMMTDLSTRSIFNSERRRGIAMASQEQLSLDALVSLGLIDAQFHSSQMPESDCELWLSNFADRLNACPPNLRQQLIYERPQLPADKLEEFDKSLFDQYWLGAEHRSRLDSFLNSRSEKRKAK